MAVSNHFNTQILLQPKLAAPSAIFARQRSYGYASSQEMTAGTHQFGFRIRKVY